MQVLLRALCPPLPGTEPVGGWALPTEEQGAWSAKLTLPGSLPQRLPSPQPSRKLSISQAVRPSGWRGRDTGWREALGAGQGGEGRGLIPKPGGGVCGGVGGGCRVEALKVQTL